MRRVLRGDFLSLFRKSWLLLELLSNVVFKLPVMKLLLQLLLAVFSCCPSRLAKLPPISGICSAGFSVHQPVSPPFPS